MLMVWKGRTGVESSEGNINEEEDMDDEGGEKRPEDRGEEEEGAENENEDEDDQSRSSAEKYLGVLDSDDDSQRCQWWYR